MITKTDAEVLASQYRTKFRDRLIIFLTNRARSGFVGGAVSYADQDGLTTEIGNTLRTEFQAAGWTVVVDTVAKTVTFS